MRHLFQVFSDDPTTLRGFILDWFSHLLILFELTQNLRSCFKRASENSRFLRRKCKGLWSLLLLEPDVWGLNWKVRNMCFSPKFCLSYLSFFWMQPQPHHSQKNVLFPAWNTSHSQVVDLAEFAAAAWVACLWQPSAPTMVLRSVGPSREKTRWKEPEKGHFLPFWGDERIHMYRYGKFEGFPV